MGDALKSRILLADDEPSLRETLEIALKREGFEPEIFSDGLSAWNALQAGQQYDAAILDIMMPRLEGTALLSRMRATGNPVPVILLTSRDEEIDRIVGLDLGADDYIGKPFSVRELIARLRAVLRRSHPRTQGNAPGSILRVAALELDNERFLASYSNNQLKLTVTEYRMLENLARFPSCLRTREQLIHEAYPDDAYANERSVDSHIKRLRRKLMDSGAPEGIIEAVYGLGYRLNSGG